LRLEISEEFRGAPDHLAVELEFLGCLYRWRTDEEVERFLRDI